MNRPKLFKIISAFFVLTLMVSCSSSDTAQTSGATTGRVSILLTDGPTDDFDQVNVTLESIRFLSEDDDNDNGEKPGIVLLDETQVINLLALENYSDWLSTTTVPVGHYSKIRLHVSQVELVKLNPDGTVYSSELAKLPANGKIDLNPQESFEIAGNGHLVIEIDMDAKKSIHIVETGNGKFIFRPVIFVNVLGEEELKLVLLDGKVLARTASDFQLCEADALEVNDSCLRVLISDDTVVQNDLIEVVAAGSVEDEDIVTVLGKASSGDIGALHIVIAAADTEPQNLALLTGEALSVVDIEGEFGLKTDDDNVIVPPQTELTVALADGSRVFDKHGAVISSESIVAGSDVDVFGLAIPDIATVSELKAAFAIVDNDVADDNITGNIVAINAAESQITVSVVDGDFSGDVCVDIEDAALLLLSQEESKVVSQAVSINELHTGMSADVYGESSDAACLDASVVLVSNPL